MAQLDGICNHLRVTALVMPGMYLQRGCVKERRLILNVGGTHSVCWTSLRCDRPQTQCEQPPVTPLPQLGKPLVFPAMMNEVCMAKQTLPP